MTKKTISDARALGEALTRATEELNLKLADAEKELGVAQRVLRLSSRLRRHGAKKHNKEWGLYVLASIEEYAEATRLFSASRLARIQAAKALPALLVRLCEVVDEDRREVDQAVVKVNETIATIRAAKVAP